MSFLADLVDPQGTKDTDEDAVTALGSLSATTPRSLTTAADHEKPSDPSPVGVDTSQIVVDEPSTNTATKMDSVETARHLADNREPSYTRHEPAISQIRHAVPGNSAVASLKHEHSSRTQSPLRESSVPMPSTELPPAPPTSVPRKRPPPKNSVKKGIASTVKREQPAVKKPPSKSKSKSSAAKRIASTSATPANSSPAPRSVRTSSTPRSSPEADNVMSGSEAAEGDDGSPGLVDDDSLYCLCHRPDTGTFMIGCDGGCEDWFHGKCVGVSEKNKNLIDRYICPNCQEKGIGVTTWKRMCRREGCRMPARIQNSNTSKYCSDDCGVLFFKDMMAKARKTAVPSNPSKGSTKNTHDMHADHDLGPRGGLLSIAEVKAMLNAAPTCESFRALGEDVTSYPGTTPNNNPTAKSTLDDSNTHASVLNDIERERVDYIKQQRVNLKHRHFMLKDRSKLITMLRDFATSLAEERNIKAKDMCGFDERITWTEDQFCAWRESPEGKDALRTNTLKPVEQNTVSTDAEGDNGVNGESTTGPCTKRKCAKHYDWYKLALEDTRFETSENGETMRALEKEEKEIKERAQLRAREIRAGGVGGTVEFHQQFVSKLQMDQKETHPKVMDIEHGIKIEDIPMIEATSEEQGQQEKEEARPDVEMNDVTAA